MTIVQLCIIPFINVTYYIAEDQYSKHKVVYIGTQHTQVAYHSTGYLYQHSTEYVYDV